MVDYLNELKDLNKKGDSKEYKKGYNRTIDDTKDPYLLKTDKKLLETGERFIEHFKEENVSPGEWRKGNSSKIASELMARGIKNKDLKYSLVGLELYNCLGLANRNSVKKRFQKAAQLNPDQKYLTEGIKILESLESKTNSSRLEDSLAIISIGAILAGIFFLSPNLTGKVIGNISKSSGNVLGGLLFILGIVGSFFTLRK